MVGRDGYEQLLIAQAEQQTALIERAEAFAAEKGGRGPAVEVLGRCWERLAATYAALEAYETNGVAAGWMRREDRRW